MLHLSKICKFKIEIFIFGNCCKLSNLCSNMHEIIKSMCELSDLCWIKIVNFFSSNIGKHIWYPGYCIVYFEWCSCYIIKQRDSSIVWIHKEQYGLATLASIFLIIQRR